MANLMAICSAARGFFPQEASAASRFSRSEHSRCTLRFSPQGTARSSASTSRSSCARSGWSRPVSYTHLLLANVQLGGMSLLSHLSGALDPFARLFGMDGVILLAFILGFPANEIVLPIIVMAYLMEGSLGDLGSLTALRELLVQNGWTVTTAVSVMLFSLMHWPCSTTCLTIKKESGSWKWTALSMAVPAIAGFSLCFLWNMLASLFLS